MKYSDEHHAHFEEHGYVRLGKVLDDAELAELQQRIDEIMLGEIPYSEMEFQLDGEDADYAKMPTVSPGHKGTTLQYRKIMGLEQDPVYLAYMQHPLFRQITRRYIGEDVSIFRAMFMNKPAEKGTILPWHQDVGVGWGVGYNPTITVWTRDRPGDGRKRLYADRARQPQARGDHRKALSLGRAASRMRAAGRGNRP